MQALLNHKVAILVADGFEQSELEIPRAALEEVGAVTQIVSPEVAAVKGWNNGHYDDVFTVDVKLDQARSENFDALLLPGGILSPNKLRTLQKALTFVRAFFEAGKPVAAICHGPQILIDAGLAEGRTMTSNPSIRMDLVNAGAYWLDQRVVSDQGLVTSRYPEDLLHFNKKVIEEFSDAVHSWERSDNTWEHSAMHIGGSSRLRDY